MRTQVDSQGGWGMIVGLYQSFVNERAADGAASEQ
jgi:hypothetical protein